LAFAPFDPDADNLQDKMKEVQEKRALLERMALT